MAIDRINFSEMGSSADLVKLFNSPITNSGEHGIMRVRFADGTNRNVAYITKYGESGTFVIDYKKTWLVRDTDQYLKFFINDEGGVAGQHGILYARYLGTSDANTNGYTLSFTQVNGTTTLYLGYDKNGRTSALGYKPFAWAPGYWYNVRLKTEGNRIRAKIWTEDGPGEQPEWDIDVRHDGSQPGYQGIGTYVRNHNMFMAEYHIAYNGDSLPDPVAHKNSELSAGFELKKLWKIIRFDEVNTGFALELPTRPNGYNTFHGFETIPAPRQYQQDINTGFELFPRPVEKSNDVSAGFDLIPEPQGNGYNTPHGFETVWQVSNKYNDTATGFSLLARKYPKTDELYTGFHIAKDDTTGCVGIFGGGFNSVLPLYCEQRKNGKDTLFGFETEPLQVTGNYNDLPAGLSLKASVYSESYFGFEIKDKDKNTNELYIGFELHGIDHLEYDTPFGFEIKGKEAQGSDINIGFWLRGPGSYETLLGFTIAPIAMAKQPQIWRSAETRVPQEWRSAETRTPQVWLEVTQDD